jgi:hypothetical protein
LAMATTTGFSEGILHAFFPHTRRHRCCRPARNRAGVHRRQGCYATDVRLRHGIEPATHATARGKVRPAPRVHRRTAVQGIGCHRRISAGRLHRVIEVLHEKLDWKMRLKIAAQHRVRITGEVRTPQRRSCHSIQDLFGIDALPFEHPDHLCDGGQLNAHQRVCD